MTALYAQVLVAVKSNSKSAQVLGIPILGNGTFSARTGGNPPQIIGTITFGVDGPKSRARVEAQVRKSTDSWKIEKLTIQPDGQQTKISLR